jgi:hypothetical protein
MKTQTLVGIIAMLALSRSLTVADPLGTAFTHHGELTVESRALTWNNQAHGSP